MKRRSEAASAAGVREVVHIATGRPRTRDLKGRYNTFVAQRYRSTRNPSRTFTHEPNRSSSQAHVTGSDDDQANSPMRMTPPVTDYRAPTPRDLQLLKEHFGLTAYEMARLSAVQPEQWRKHTVVSRRAKSV